MNTQASRLAACGAATTLIGATTSGPVAFALVAFTHPQPPWRDAALFAERYHPVQLLPFVCGFLLIGGFGTLAAGLHEMARPELRARTMAALVFTSAFVALVFFNYFAQTILVPGWVQPYASEHAIPISIFSMSNPRSLAWAIEMGAYGLLGIATWLQAPVFEGAGLPRWTAQLFVTNGVISVAGTLATIAIPGWVLTTAGLIAFGAWNAVIIAASALAWRVLQSGVPELRNWL